MWSSTSCGRATAEQPIASSGSWPTAAITAGTGGLQFPEGSFGNGGAMRIAPVGLAYRHTVPKVLRQAVEYAICRPHVRPEAIDGAFVQAKAVAIAATSEPESFDPTDMLQSLLPLCRTERMRAKLDALSDIPRHGDADVFIIVRVRQRHSGLGGCGRGPLGVSAIRDEGRGVRDSRC